MKKRIVSFQLFKRLPIWQIFTFILFFSLSNLSAQKVGEECDKGKCDSGLYCVDVKIKGVMKKLCSECNQTKLNGKTKIVGAKCKWMENGQGWYPDKNPLYLKAISKADNEQDRVPITIFDDLLEKVKECREAREDRDDECWDGGNKGHIEASEGVRKMAKNIADLKGEAVAERAVFYSSKSTYESAMRDYISKCRSLNFSKIEDALEDMERDYKSGKEIDCDDLEKFMEDCEGCVSEAKSLIQYAFDGSSGKTPEDVQEAKDESESLIELAEEILKEAKSKDLCD